MNSSFLATCYILSFYEIVILSIFLFFSVVFFTGSLCLIRSLKKQVKNKY